MDEPSSLSLPVLANPEGVDRRSFFRETVRLAALALLAEACAGTDSITGPRLSSPLTVTLADYPQLAQVGGVARISGASAPMALANLGNGDYVALSLVCPHAGGIVQWYGSSFVCPVHGATFSDSGRWIGGQPTSSLHEYPTTYDAAAGTVTIQPG